MVPRPAGRAGWADARLLAGRARLGGAPAAARHARDLRDAAARALQAAHDGGHLLVLHDHPDRLCADWAAAARPEQPAERSHRRNRRPRHLGARAAARPRVGARRRASALSFCAPDCRARAASHRARHHPAPTPSPQPPTPPAPPLPRAARAVASPPPPPRRARRRRSSRATCSRRCTGAGSRGRARRTTTRRGTTGPGGAMGPGDGRTMAAAAAATRTCGAATPAA